jgi:hypothetical protein
MPKIEFDEASHIYRVDGKVYPSVTQILSSAGLPDLSMVPADILEWKSDLGTKVHRAMEFEDDGDLDEENLAPEIRPYLDAYRKFKQESGFEPLAAEELIWHPVYKYPGRPDRIGPLNGKTVLIDYKTGMIDLKCVGPQTAAYTESWNHTHDKKDHISKRFALKLNKDGTYKLVECKNDNDFGIFICCLSLYNWRSQ